MQNVGIQITAKDDTGNTFKTVGDKLKGVQQDAAGVGETVGGLVGKFNAIGIALAAVAGAALSVKSAIDTADEFSKMAQKTGVAVEQLRELNFAAALSDVSTEALGTGLRKLSVNMAAAAGGSKEQAEVFKALGLSVKDASGNLKGADVVLSEVAGKFANFKDGPEKAALAIQLFGKAGADMIPLLNAGSSGLSEMAQEARDLGAVFDGKFGKQSEEFNDNLTRIGISTQSAGYAIAAELLPSMNLLAQAFIDGQKATSGFGSVIGTVLKTGLESAIILVTDVAFVIKGVGTEIGGVIAQLNALGEGGGVFSAKGRAAWAAVGQAMREDAAAARAALDKYQYQILNAGTAPRLLGDTQTSAPIVKAAAATAKQISDYEKLTRAIAEKTAVAKLDLDTQEKLTEGQKLAAKFESDLILATLKMTDAEVKSTRAKLASLVVIEQATVAKAAATKRMVAEYEQELQTEKELSDARIANDNARAAGITTVSNYADAIAEQNTYSQLELSLMGSTAVAREIALGQYRVELDLKKQIEAIDSNPGFNPDQKIIERARARAAASQATAGIETKAYTDEWKRTSDTINSTLTDALMRGFESGKDFAKNMRDTIVNMFKTMVLRPVISAVMNPIAGALTGALGLSGAAQAAGTGSSVLSSVGTIAGLASTFGAGLKAGFAGLMGEAGLMGTLSAGTTALGAGNIAGGLGTLGGPLALATAAILGLSAIIKATSGETRNGAKYGVGSDGLAIKLEGPSGGEIAAKEAQAMFNVAKSSIEGMLTGFGSKAVLTGFTAGLESSVNGKGFAYATGQINGKSFGDTNTFANSRGDKTQEQALKDYQKELSQSILEALQVTEDIPAAVAKMISDGLNGSEVKALSLEATSAILANVENLSKQVNTFGADMTQLPFEALKNLSFDATAGLIAAAGGFEKLDASLTGYYQNFYREDEQRAQSILNLEAAFAALGKTMPVLDASARDVYRSMVEEAAAKDLSVEANQKAYAALLSLQGSMNELAPAFESAATSFKDVAISAAEAAATMTSAWASVMQSRGVAANDVTRFTAQAAIDAAFNEFKKTDKFGIASASQFQTITQADFKNYTGDNQKLIATILNGFSDLSKANAPAVEAAQAAQTYTQEAYNAPAIDTSIADAIAAITKGLTDAGVSLGVELLKAQGKTVEAMAAQRAIDTAGYNAAQVAAYDYNQALRDQITALNDAAASQARIASERAGLQDQYDALTLTSAQLLAKQRDALDVSNQALFDGITAIKAETAAKEASAKSVAEGVAFMERQEQKLQAILSTNAGLRDQLAVLDGSKTQQQVDRARQLADATDSTAKSIILQIQAQQDINDAAAAVEAASTAAAESIKALAATNQGWQDQLDVLTGKETDRSIALRDASDASTVALMNQVYAQQDLKTAAEAATAAAQQVSDERTGLQDQLNQLTLTSAQLLGLQREALDASNRSLFDQVQAATAAKTAADEAAQAVEAMAQRVKGSIESLASNKLSLQSQLLTAQGNPAGALAATRGNELSALTAGLSAIDAAAITAAYSYNAALEDQIKTLNDATAASDALKAKQEALTATNKGYQDQLDVLTGAQTDRTLALRDATDASTVALLKQIYAQQDIKTAAEASAAALAEQVAKQEALTATNKGYQDQLDVLLGAQTDRSIALRDATDGSTRALMTQVYAQQDLKAASEAASAALKSWGDKMQTLGDAKGGLQVDLMAAQGRTADAAALRRQIDLSSLTLGTTPEQTAAITAAYDYNAALREQITTLNDASAAAKALASTNKGYQDQLDILTGAQTDRSIALRDTTDASTRALMAQVYAQQDLKTATAEATAAAEAATAASIAAAKESLSQAESSLRSAYESQKSALQSTADAFGGFIKSLLAYKNQLLQSDSTLSPEDAYTRAKASFAQTSMLAQSGDQTAISELQAVSQAMLSASKDYNASGTAYQSDLKDVLASLDGAGRAANIEKTIAEQQLTTLKSQVGALISIDTSVKSVESAIREYLTAQTAVKSATAGTASGTAASSTGGSFDSLYAVKPSNDAANGYTSDIYGSSDRKLLSATLYGKQESIKLSDERYAATFAAQIKNGDIAELRAAAEKMGSDKFQLAVADLAAEYKNWAESVVANPNRSQVQRDAFAANLENLKYLTDPALRGFAGGGYASPGWAMVGEDGPEIVNFSQPGRVYTAAQTSEAINGKSDGEVVRELQATRAVLNAIMAKIDEGDKDNTEATRRVERRIASLESSQRLAAAAPAPV